MKAPAHKMSDLWKVPKGVMFAEGVNAIPREAVVRIGDEDAVRLFDEADKKKWYGELSYPGDTPVIKATFRRGVCQFVKIRRMEGKALFWLNVINDNVSFGGKE